MEPPTPRSPAGVDMWVWGVGVESGPFGHTSNCPHRYHLSNPKPLTQKASGGGHQLLVCLMYTAENITACLVDPLTHAKEASGGGEQLLVRLQVRPGGDVLDEGAVTPVLLCGGV